MTAFEEGDAMSATISGELALKEIVALIASGAESTHTLQGVFEVFVRNNLQTDIPPLKIQ